MDNETELHYYVFESWPDGEDAPAYNSYPLVVADHIQVTAANVDEATAEAISRAGKDRFVILASHNRYKCSPPHGGRN